MTPLERDLRHRIALEGPLGLSDYMTLCLTHPEHGYYTTGHPVGGRASAERSGGDFITAPEVSQIFGELIGIWCIEMWQALGSPAAINLVELGPGRGTLMKDLLRAARSIPEFDRSAHVHLVEISPSLSEQQSLTLSATKSISWIRDLDDLPKRPTLIIANEFLDALPFRQWYKHEGQWLERAVGLMNDALTLVLRPGGLDPALLPKDHAERPDGTLFETAPAREAFISRAAEWISLNSGAALFIDYGHLETGYGDTFQAVRNHAYASPLHDPGLADLTSHVDFEPLVATAKAEGCVVPRPVSQGEFLIQLGLLERAGALGADKSAHIQNELHKAVQRLAAGDQMGDLFKVMAIGAPDSLSERFAGF
ncbi:MAG: class I SAM-dependent methyltransferase [Rhizobiaceae bacterium]